MNSDEQNLRVSILERGREAAHIAEGTLHREREEQQHLWRRYRDVVKLYVAQLGLLGLCVERFAAAETSWFDTNNTWWVTSALGVSGLAAILCLYKLYQVFDGDFYACPKPQGLKQSLLYLDHWYRDELEPEDFVYSDFYEMSKEEMFQGGMVISASIGEALQNHALRLLESAEANYEANKKRSKLLACARWSLILGVFSAIVAWIFTTAGS